MREFFRLFFTDRRWFLGTLIVLFIFIISFWMIIDPESFIQAVNNIFSYLWAILKLVFVLAIAILGIRIIFGYRPWK